MMEIPDLETPLFQALEAEAIARCTKLVREAIPMPIVALQALEHMARGGSSLPARQLLSGFILCMVYGSLRFDDALHVCPAELQFRDGNLRGRVWQTKVDRKRKGTVFVVPNVSLTSTPWLVQWYNFSVELLSEEADFWLPHTEVVVKGSYGGDPNS